MTPHEANRQGYDSLKGSRCPWKSGTDLALEWTRGRDQRNRVARADVRPAFRKSGKRFERYTPPSCR